MIIVKDNHDCSKNFIIVVTTSNSRRHHLKYPSPCDIHMMKNVLKTPAKCSLPYYSKIVSDNLCVKGI